VNINTLNYRTKASIIIESIDNIKWEYIGLSWLKTELEGKTYYVKSVNLNKDQYIISVNEKHSSKGLDLTTSTDTEVYIGCVENNNMTIIQIKNIELENSNVKKRYIKLDKEFNKKNSSHFSCQIKIQEKPDIDISLWVGYQNKDGRVKEICKRAEEKNIPYNENHIRNLLDYNSEVCSYCGISEKQIEILDNELKDHRNKTLSTEYGLTSRHRGAKLEIDQIDPKQGYIDGNMALCCYWCNNAKTDTFSLSEFKSIAKGINEAWRCKSSHIKDFKLKDFNEIKFWNERANECK